MKKRFIKTVAAACVAAIVLSGGMAFAGTTGSASETFSRFDCMEKLMNVLHIELPIDIKKCMTEHSECIPGLNGGNGDNTQKPEQNDPQKPEQGNPDTPQQPGNPDSGAGKTENNDNSNNQNNNQNNNDSNINSSSYTKQVADFVNEERSAAGLPELAYNSELAKVAQLKAEDMRDNNYFEHVSPTYGTPFEMMQEFGIEYIAAGENIAKGQKTPETVMDAWMNSEGHKLNILHKNYEQIGVGYCTDENGNTYWVQMFIK